jgi:hypothetical protein
MRLAIRLSDEILPVYLYLYPAGEWTGGGGSILAHKAPSTALCDSSLGSGDPPGAQWIHLDPT